MTAEEKELERMIGKKQPFAVPDGYFDRFADGMMARLPEQQPVVQVPRAALWRRLRPAIAVAACAGAVVWGAMQFVHSDKTAPAHDAIARNTTAVYSASADGYSSLDVAADYTMIDNDDIYAIVADIQ